VDPRDELIRIQKRLLRRLRKEIRHIVRENTPLLVKYREEYEREVAHYARVATQRELVERVADSDIVYCGDYHTLAQAQRTPVKILQQVLARSQRKVVLCIEAVLARCQAYLDDYMAGRLSEKEFLKKIDYEHTWSFVWEHYGVLLDFAREHGLRVVGINSEPEGIRGRLEARDRVAAEIIVAETERDPSALLFVLDGDWHVSSTHLPAQVEKVLRKKGLTRRRLIIFQNSEKIYWRLAARRMEHKVDVVQIAKDKYCVLNTTPVVKLRTYLNWVEEVEELGYAALWRNEAPHAVMEDELLQIMNTVADFIGLPREGLDEFSVYSVADLDFLEALVRRRHFTEPEVREIKRQIERDESYYLPRGHIIYLSNLSLNHAAEEATHFINHLCAGEFARPETPRDAFYQKVVAEALGFLGSKIVNQKRTCYRERDFREFLREKRGRFEGGRGGELSVLRKVARFVLSHRGYERRVFRTGRRTSPPRAVFRQEPDVLYAVVHSLGYLLGNSLYYGLIWNRVDKSFVRSLFFENFKERRPFDVYMDVSLLLQGVRIFNIIKGEACDDLGEEVDLDA